MNVKFSKKDILGWLGIFLLALLAFYISSHPKANTYTNSDPYGTVFLAQVILDTGNIRLDAYADQLPKRYMFTTINGHIYNNSTIGSSISILPLIKASNLLGKRVSLDNDPKFQRKIASGTVALVMILVFLLARRYLNLQLSLLISTVCIFGTPLLSTSGTGLWNLNFAVVYALVVLILLTYDGILGKYRFVPYLIGFFLFMAFLTRPTSAIFILFVFGYLLLLKKEYFIRVGCTALGFLLVFIVFSWMTYHTPLPPYYLLVAKYTSDFWRGFYGVWLSPSRGLLIFCPFLILFLIGAFIYLFKSFNRKLIFLLLGTIGLHTIMIGRWVCWWGGHSYGPRILTDLFPIFVFTGILVTEWVIKLLSKKWQNLYIAVFTVTGIFAIWIHTYQGMLNPYTKLWNINPNVDHFPQLLFDWRFPQFLMNANFYEKKKEWLPEYRNGIVIDPSSPYAKFISWYDIEYLPDTPSFRWSANQSAQIKIHPEKTILESDLDLVLVLKLGAFGVQEIGISVYGQQLVSDLKLEPAPQQVIVNIPRAKIGNNPDLVIDFSIPGAITPEKGNDPRVLGIQFFEGVIQWEK